MFEKKGIDSISLSSLFVVLSAMPACDCPFTVNHCKLAYSQQKFVLSVPPTQ